MKSRVDRSSVHSYVELDSYGWPRLIASRTPVKELLDLLAHGYSVEDIMGKYPQMDRTEWGAAMAYAAETVRRAVLAARP
ncbi:MAG: DUF433 domain-containing protein [Symploca sp. SIO1C4]|uniref:DUF433 domain-containing protein n=1 Tax=Symploca sp. SIO1C4 TaxID=2607765 RepID=A0A6B3NES7_9CYAN|nr:DUF433 domain-containing protein [Symploca sp. SIO1C4]